MFRQTITFTTLLCLLSACHGPTIGQRQDIIIVDCIRKENNFNFAKEGFVRIGRSDAYDTVAGKIKEFYQTRKKRFDSVAVVRPFFTKFFAEYVQPINQDKRLKSYFPEFPLTSKTVDIEITFLDDFAKPLQAPYIARVRNIGEKVIFYSYDETSNRFIEVDQEPFTP